MGERKGQNKYYPPDYDPKFGGLNKFMVSKIAESRTKLVYVACDSRTFHIDMLIITGFLQGTHALRERAKKLDEGILIIRFEMPYNIWCEGCNNHVGMGVRYNAQKKKIGMYYTTPVYQFRMKCHLCDNHYEIKTDPGKLDYEIVSGARRQENRWDPTENGQIVPDDKEVQKRLFDDPMFKLEHKAVDQKSADDAKPILGKLYERNRDVWSDPYESNAKLRAAFRKRKSELKVIQDQDDAILKKSSLSIELLPENEQDRKIAALMNLQSRNINEVQRERQKSLMETPILRGVPGGSTKVDVFLKQKLNRSNLGITLARNVEEAPSTSTSVSATLAPLPPAALRLVQAYSSSDSSNDGE